MLSLLTRYRYRPVVKFRSSNPTDAWNWNHSQHIMDFCFLWMFPNHHSFQDHGSVSIFTYIFTASKNIQQSRCFKRLSRPPRNKWPGHEDLFPAKLPRGDHPLHCHALDIQTPENLRRCVDPSKYAKKNTF